MTPIDHFRGVWTRCDQLTALHNYLANSTTSALQPDEILRAEWVMRISALDLFIHELVAQRMLAIFEGTLPAPPAFAKFQVPTDVLLRIRAAPTPLEAAAAFDLQVRTQLGRSTFQFPEDIAEGVRLCSSVEVWNEIATHQGSTAQDKTEKAKALKLKLSLFVRRRNAIAHEGDLVQGVTRTPNPISAADVAIVKDFVADLVASVNAVVI